MSNNEQNSVATEKWEVYGDENFAENGGLLLRHAYSEAERAADPTLENKFDVVSLYVDKDIDDTIENRNVIWQGFFDLDDFMDGRDALDVDREYGTDFHLLSAMDNAAIILNLDGAEHCNISPMAEHTSSNNAEVKDFLDKIGFTGQVENDAKDAKNNKKSSKEVISLD